VGESTEGVTGSVAMTCRYYGISRACFYVWLERYREFGADGLRDRSKRPHSSPNATAEEMVGKIIYLRQHYHFGPQRVVSTGCAARNATSPIGSAGRGTRSVNLVTASGSTSSSSPRSPGRASGTTNSQSSTTVLGSGFSSYTTGSTRRRPFSSSTTPCNAYPSGSS
jgi:uncharacterized protein with GYD domain